MNESNDFIKFLLEHRGAIIGGLISAIIIFTPLKDVLIGLVVIIAGIWLGNYVQKNKENVKEKLRRLIDKF